jgi:hypothetical protein
MEALGLVLQQTKPPMVAVGLVAHRRLRATLATVELVDFTVAVAVAAVLHLLMLATQALAATAHPALWLSPLISKCPFSPSCYPQLAVS